MIVVIVIVSSFLAPAIQHYISPPEPCSLAKICNHTWVFECGKENVDSEARLFLDKCDMFEYNCNYKKAFARVEMKLCSSNCTQNVKSDHTIPMKSSPTPMVITTEVTTLITNTASPTNILTSVAEMSSMHTVTTPVTNSMSVTETTTTLPEMSPTHKVSISLINTESVTEISTTVLTSPSGTGTTPITSSEAVTETITTVAVNLSPQTVITPVTNSLALTEKMTTVAVAETTTKISQAANEDINNTSLKEIAPDHHLIQTNNTTDTVTEATVSKTTFKIANETPATITDQINQTTLTHPTSNNDRNIVTINNKTEATTGTNNKDTPELDTATSSSVTELVTQTVIFNATMNNKSYSQNLNDNTIPQNTVSNITNKLDIEVTKPMKTENTSESTVSRNVPTEVTCTTYPKECNRPSTWETPIEGETRDFFQILRERYGDRVQLLKDTTHWPRRAPNLLSRKRDSFVSGHHNERE